MMGHACLRAGTARLRDEAEFGNRRLDYRDTEGPVATADPDPRRLGALPVSLTISRTSGMQDLLTGWSN